MILYFIYFLKFFKFKTFLFLLNTQQKNTLIKSNKKKNLFFKKKAVDKIYLSKRLSLILKKKWEVSMGSFKKQNRDSGNFFFKKFFLKTLYSSRVSLKSFFFLPSKTRQKKITKIIFKNSKKFFLSNMSYEYTVINILIRCNMFSCMRDALFTINSNCVYVNGLVVINANTILNIGDCLQISIFDNFYKFIKFFRKFFKKKVAIFKFHAWRYFKHKFILKNENIDKKKRKNPKYLLFFFFFKLNVPKFLEIDYLTLSIFFLTKESIFVQTSYYLNKLFSWKLFPLYNYKKIN
jgi:hypothetical protein